MANVHDLAAYLLERNNDRMSTMKLQKLCYYVQGWSLAWDQVPVFPEEIQAWMNGPIVDALFQMHRGRFTLSSWELGDPDKLSLDERETVHAVFEAYGHLTGQQLSDMTHREAPFIDARAGLPDSDRGSAVISLESMEAYFSALDKQSDNNVDN